MKKVNQIKSKIEKVSQDESEESLFFEEYQSQLNHLLIKNSSEIKKNGYDFDHFMDMSEAFVHRFFYGT